MDPGEYCYVVASAFISFGRTSFSTCKGSFKLDEPRTRLEITSWLIDSLVNQILHNPLNGIDGYAGQEPAVQFISIEPN